MKSIILFTISILLVALTVSFDHLAKHFYLYWQSGWIDQAIHFLGGLSATLFFGWFFYYSNYFKVTNKRATFIIFIIYILLVGILWEIYEYHFGIIHYSPYFFRDTVLDLLMDLLGGLLAYFLTAIII